MIDGFSVVERIPVLWGDMDALGHVNNARFFTWFETARIAYFGAVGFRADRASGVGPILAHTSCDYLAPVEHPGEVLAGARVTRIGGKSLHHEYVIADASVPGAVVARGTGVIVFYDYESGVSVPVPDQIRSAIEELDGVA